eukprot:3979371-Amphidinium_carterae.1
MEGSAAVGGCEPQESRRNSVSLPLSGALSLAPFNREDVNMGGVTRGLVVDLASELTVYDWQMKYSTILIQWAWRSTH